LEQIQPEMLPFELSVQRPERLVGKRRPRVGDSPETKALRERLNTIDGLVEIVASMDDNAFEYLCAAIIVRNGASDANVTAHSDDGGIDVFGRLPVLVGDSRIPRGLARTTLDVRDILFLCQAKRYGRQQTIGRDELQKFAGQSRDCLTAYRNIERKPSHRVPASYYVEEELCLTLFMTSASFSRQARSYADGVNMVLADGRLIAELLVVWGVGGHPGSATSSDAVLDWSMRMHEGRPFSGP